MVRVGGIPIFERFLILSAARAQARQPGRCLLLDPLAARVFSHPAHRLPAARWRSAIALDMCHSMPFTLNPYLFASSG